VTVDKTFECLLISRDPGVLCILNELLEKLSVSSEVCFSSSKAADRLSERAVDLVIIDYEDDSREVLRQIEETVDRGKPTVVAVSEAGEPIAGAHAVIAKPVKSESCAEPLRLAYVRMLREHRRHARYPLMSPLTATDQNSRLIPVTVANIGDGGVGLIAEDSLEAGDVLSFRLALPEIQQSIHAEARVQWTRNGAAGCEFVRIPPVELVILHDWLKTQCRVKPPAVEL